MEPVLAEIAAGGWEYEWLEKKAPEGDGKAASVKGSSEKHPRTMADQ